MLSCDDAHRLLACAADGEGVEDAVRAQELDDHLAGCAACRTSLNEQRAVAAVLRSRPAQAPSPEFERRLAARLDDASGWLGIVDARRWTFRLVPVAAVLALVAIAGSSTTTTPQPTQTIEDWARSSVDSASGAAMLWQQDVNAESLLEVMVTGGTSATAGGEGSVR